MKEVLWVLFLGLDLSIGPSWKFFCQCPYLFLAILSEPRITDSRLKQNTNLVTLRSILLFVSKQLIVTGSVAELDDVANAVMRAWKNYSSL